LEVDAPCKTVILYHLKIKSSEAGHKAWFKV